MAICIHMLTLIDSIKDCQLKGEKNWVCTFYASGDIAINLLDLLCLPFLLCMFVGYEIREPVILSVVF